jgi:hypothetical protein
LLSALSKSLVLACKEDKIVWLLVLQTRRFENPNEELGEDIILIEKGNTNVEYVIT